MTSPVGRHRKPIPLEPGAFDTIYEDNDPAELHETAELTARLLVYRTRESNDPFLAQRLVALAETEGLEFLSSLWAQSPERTLSRALWMLYAIRSVIEKDPEHIRLCYELGKGCHDVNRVIAGLADPPDTEEIRRSADEILSGAFTGDFDIALRRFAAFCKIISSGQTAQASAYKNSDPSRASSLNANAFKLEKTAFKLEEAATLWRDGMLD